MRRETHPGPTGHPSEEGIEKQHGGISPSPPWRGGRRPGWVIPLGVRASSPQEKKQAARMAALPGRKKMEAREQVRRSDERSVTRQVRGVRNHPLPGGVAEGRGGLSPWECGLPARKRRNRRPGWPRSQEGRRGGQESKFVGRVSRASPDKSGESEIIPSREGWPKAGVGKGQGGPWETHPGPTGHPSKEGIEKQHGGISPSPPRRG